jgi:hypothetical protein
LGRVAASYNLSGSIRETSIAVRHFTPLSCFARSSTGELTYRGDVKMKLNWRNSLVCAALAAMAVPVWAASESAQFMVDQPTTIGGYTLQPGDYDLKADKSKNEVTVEQNGEVLTKVPCTWIQLPQKADATQVITDQSKVTELDFNGRTDAAKLSQ